MADFKRTTFTVTTIGEGQPDYSSPEIKVTSVMSAAEATQQALIVNFPQTENAGQKYDDFAKIAFTTAQTEYVVGTNANAAKPDSWGAGVVAKQINVYATKPCYLRFNDATSVAHEIPAEVPSIRFFRRVEKLYVNGVNSSGTLYVWIEG